MGVFTLRLGVQVRVVGCGLNTLVWDKLFLRSVLGWVLVSILQSNLEKRIIGMEPTASNQAGQKQQRLKLHT